MTRRTLGAFAVLVVLALALLGRAKAEGNRAGLVVQFGDGGVRTFCLDLGGPERTGEELLTLAGLDVVAESKPLGAQVCRIDGDGCDYPGEACWCHCPVTGPECRYWAYFTLRNGRWLYSNIGATARTVRPGDVDGWAWGAGEFAPGSEPALKTFDEICGPAPTLTPTSTLPIPTPTPSRSPTVPSATRPRPSGTPRPGAGAGAGPTLRPSLTPRSSATPRGQLSATPSLLSGTDAAAEAARRATAGALIAMLTALPWPTGVTEPTETEVATEPSVAAIPDFALPPGLPAPQPTLVQIPISEPRTGGADAPAGRANPDGTSTGYLAFGLVVGLLGLGWVWLRRR